jgi:nucleoside-diphosphate-sugar epimerase
VDLEGNRYLIDVAKAAGVKQFIFVSALLADPHSPVPFMQAKGQTEDYLRESGIPFGGPQPLSFRDAVTIYERVLGHEMVAQLLAGLDTYDSPLDMTETARTFGIQLTPLEVVVRRTATSVASA